MRERRKKKESSRTAGNRERAHGGSYSRKPQVVHLVLFTLAAIGAACFIYLQARHIVAKDSLYHLRHASLYVSNGLFMKEFPWLTCSVISTHGADIWYGFHLLFIPFTFIHDTLAQAKIAGVLLLTVLLVLLYVVMRRERMSCAFLWPFVFASISGPFAGRLTTTRPHILSTGLAALLFSFMIHGSARSVFLVSMALTFFHLSFFWLGILIGFTVTLVRFITERTWELRKSAALLIGLTIGWLLRPNPIGAAKIAYVQIFLLMLEKQKALLAFGRELYPLKLRPLISEYGLFALLWLGFAAISLIAILLRRAKLSSGNRILFWSSLALSALFFILAVFVSSRAADQWALFGVILIAAGFTHFLAPRKDVLKEGLGRKTRIIGICAAAIIFACMTWRFLSSPELKRGYGVYPYQARAAAEWLKNNSRPGEIVFHVNWGEFPELFYWNQHNRYIGGMDPIFQYAYDKGLYWKAHHLLVGKAVDHTWGSQEVGGANPEDTYTVIRRDFQASYLFLEKYRSPALFLYARDDDSRFVRCFDDRRTAIFRLSDAEQTEPDN